MRILDVNDNELQEEEIDLELGHLIPDKVFVKHHDAVEYQPRDWHYWPQTYYFEDETRYSVIGKDDPHVKVNDLASCSFSWNVLEGEEPKQVRGIDVIEFEISPEVFAQEAYDEYEDIQRYILYTQEELDQKAEEKAREEKRTNFMENGPDILDKTVASLEETNLTVEDLVLMMADMVGGNDEEEVVE